MGSPNPISTWVNDAISAVTLGVVKPDRKGAPISPGVFGGKHGASEYGQDYLGMATVTLSDQRPRQKLGDAQVAREARDAQTRTQQQAQADAATAARTETPQEAYDARQRAGSAYETLGRGGKRRASQSLTDPGATLSGSY